MLKWRLDCRWVVVIQSLAQEEHPGRTFFLANFFGQIYRWCKNRTAGYLRRLHDRFLAAVALQNLTPSKNLFPDVSLSYQVLGHVPQVRFDTVPLRRQSPARRPSTMQHTDVVDEKDKVSELLYIYVTEVF